MSLFLLPTLEPPENSPDLAENEKFDISILSVIRDELLILFGMSHVDDEVLSSLIDVFYRGSVFYDCLPETEAAPVRGSSNLPRQTPISARNSLEHLKGTPTSSHPTTNYSLGIDLKVRSREDFSRACFELLFELCSNERLGKTLYR